MNDPVLFLNSVSKSFVSTGEKLTILDNLNLAILPASKTVIIGESGCGKSTLLNIIGGLESPTSGSIRAGPFEVETLDEKRLTLYRSTFLGLVFQFHYLLKDFTALENVMLPAYMAGMKKKGCTRTGARPPCGFEAREPHAPLSFSDVRGRAAAGRSGARAYQQSFPGSGR